MRKLLTFAAFAALAVAVAACTGGDDDDDVASASPSPSPSPTGTAILRNVTVNVTGATPHNGSAGSVRFKSGTTVASCIDRAPVTGGNLTLSTNGKLVNGTNYTVIELVLNLNTGNAYNSGTDHGYSHTAVTVTSNLILNFDHAAPAAGGWTGPGTITWTNGSGCPGG